MKEIEQIKIALGFVINENNELNKNGLNEVIKYKDYLHDIHIPHFNGFMMGSGRLSPLADIKSQEFFIIDNALEHGIQVSILMNYMVHDNYKLILRDFKDNFYSRGIRSVVIADLELIKRMKQAFPDLYIQGSCLSYRMTEDELYEEAKEGVEIHNPSVDIIRDYKQLIANHNAGFKQKIIFGEGCLHKCPFERIEKGHRWHIARNLLWISNTNCISLIKNDPRIFYRANWVTIKRLKELSDYIEVFKLPRIMGANRQELANNNNNATQYHYLDLFFDLYQNDINYNILDFNGVMYGSFLRRKYKKIPSEYFDKDFFDTIGYCDMKCKELNCHKCYNIQKRLEKNYSRMEEIS